jgi:hypothetical protein
MKKQAIRFEEHVVASEAGRMLASSILMGIFNGGRTSFENHSCLSAD